MQEFLARYGLLAVFIGAIVEGDVVMIMAGVAAHLRLFDLPDAIVTGWAGGMVADFLAYVVGRSWSTAIRRTAMYARARRTIERLARSFGAKEIIVARFAYGTRLPSMLFWGLQRLPFSRFAAFDVVGCGLWSAAFATLGFVLSNQAAAVLGDVKRIEHWMLGAALFAAVLVGVSRLVIRRRLG